MDNGNILIVDDEKEIRDLVEIYLKSEGYTTLQACDGLEAVKIVENEKVDLVILDVMMPIKDGNETVVEIRDNSSIPIIMISAKAEDDDKINGLNIGADDYITKPFNPKELLARVKSALRRYMELGNEKENNENIYQVKGLIIDDNLKKVTVDGKEVKLTPTEYNILKFLTANKGKVFSIDQIYESIWNEDCYGAENIIAVHIRHIREKIEINPKEPRYLKVIWGIGYKVENL